MFDLRTLKVSRFFVTTRAFKSLKNFSCVATLIKWKFNKCHFKSVVVRPTAVEQIGLDGLDWIVVVLAERSHKHLAVAARTLSANKASKDETSEHFNCKYQLIGVNFAGGSFFKQCEQEGIGGR